MGMVDINGIFPLIIPSSLMVMMGYWGMGMLGIDGIYTPITYGYGEYRRYFPSNASSLMGIGNIDNIFPDINTNISV